MWCSPKNIINKKNNKMKTIIKSILIICILITLFGMFYGYWKVLKSAKPEIIFKTDTIYSEKTEFNIKPVVVIPKKDNELLNLLKNLKEKNVLLNDSLISLHDLKPIIDTVYVYIDNYLTKKIYSDTIFNNDTAFLVVNDVIYRNNIDSRSTVLKTYNTTKTIIQDKNGFFIGASYAPFTQNYLIGVDYKFKKFNFGIDLNNEDIFLTVKYRLKN